MPFAAASSGRCCWGSTFRSGISSPTRWGLSRPGHSIASRKPPRDRVGWIRGHQPHRRPEPPPFSSPRQFRVLQLQRTPPGPALIAGLVPGPPQPLALLRCLLWGKDVGTGQKVDLKAWHSIAWARLLADGVGFEPTVEGLLPRRFSRPLPSTARPPVPEGDKVALSGAGFKPEGTGPIEAAATTHRRWLIDRARHGREEKLPEQITGAAFGVAVPPHPRLRRGAAIPSPNCC